MNDLYRLAVILLVWVSGFSSGELLSAAAQDESAATQDESAAAVLEKYCATCHAAKEPAGDFRIDELRRDVGSDRDDVDPRSVWLKAEKQLKVGTMPPADEAQPTAREREQLIRWIEQKIFEAETALRAQQGRAVMRRLNQTEYANTVRDLLDLDVDLEGVLPDDSVVGGFDTAADSLHFSSFLLDGYFEAANRVLDAAFANGPQPWILDRRFDPKDERVTRRTNVYRHVDDGVAVFASDLASNIQIVFWNCLTRFQGKYRFRISAYAYQTDQPVLFHINGGRENLGDPPYLIDYFEVPPGEPTVIEWVADMEARRNIRLLVDTEIRPRELERMGGAADYEGPGLVVQWLEVEGPLLPSWPPPSYRMLVGDLRQQPVAGDSDRREVISDQPIEDAERILRKFARRAFRREVTDDEVERLLSRVRSKLEQGASFERALRVGLKAVLVSPDFLFLRQHVRTGRDTGVSADDKVQTLDDYSLASRLSYFLWSSMPDEELMRLAENRELSRPVVLRQQVERMLSDKKAAAFTENFVGQWLRLREIDATQPDRQLYPEYDKLLRASMTKEVYGFFDEVLRNDLSLTNFIDSDFSMLNGRLAEHYGIPDVTGLSFRKVQLPPGSHRGGVMTMAAVLKVSANGTTTSPIVRGAWVLDTLLGMVPPPPPAGVEAVDPDIRGATTIREQLAKHRQVESCATCHSLIDPHGFALENFDVIGGWRDHYRSIGEGTTVQVNGRRMRYKHGPAVDAADVLRDGRRFSTIDEYKQLLLADKDLLTHALATKLLAYATGVAPATGNRATLKEIVSAVGQQGYGFRTLVHEVVQSELFRNK